MKEAVLAVLLMGLSPAASQAEEVAILARDLSARSQNISPEYAGFGNLTLCVGRGGFMEWAFEVKGGSYYVHFLYCSGERRPCRMSISDKGLQGEVLGETTGGFMPADLAWGSYGPVALVKGENRVRLTAEGFMPHFKGIFISQNERPPRGGPLGPAQSVFPASKEEREDALSKLNTEGLRKAIRYLAEKYGQEYPGGKEYLHRVDAIAETARPRIAHSDRIRSSNGRSAAPNSQGHCDIFGNAGTSFLPTGSARAGGIGKTLCGGRLPCRPELWPQSRRVGISGGTWRSGRVLPAAGAILVAIIHERQPTKHPRSPRVFIPRKRVG